MKITNTQLTEWAAQNTLIRYRGEYYRLRHQGLTAWGKPNGSTEKGTRKYFLMPSEYDGTPRTGTSIKVYHKGRGIYGLVTNK